MLEHDDAKLPVETDRLNKKSDDKESFLLRMPKRYREALDAVKAKTKKSMSDMFSKALELYSRK
jgi:hypothetical protein